MCGICGIIENQSSQKPERETIVRKMMDRMIHRGPDDKGIWIDKKNLPLDQKPITSMT